MRISTPTLRKPPMLSNAGMSSLQPTKMNPLKSNADSKRWPAECRGLRILSPPSTRHVHIVDMRGIGSVWGPGIGKHIANTGDLLSAGEDLRTICEDKEACLLVMDPLSGAFGGNENDRTAVYDFVSSFRGWGDTVGCAMLVIGHLPKSAEGKAAGFSGSTAWEASARSMWMLGRQSFEENSTDKDNNKQTRYYWDIITHKKQLCTTSRINTFSQNRHRLVDASGNPR